MMVELIAVLNGRGIDLRRDPDVGKDATKAGIGVIITI